MRRTERKNIEGFVSAFLESGHGAFYAKTADWLFRPLCLLSHIWYTDTNTIKHERMRKHGGSGDL